MEKKFFNEIGSLLPKTLKAGQNPKKVDITFEELFRNSKNDIDVFLEILGRPDINAIDQESNWDYDGPKSSIVACFAVLADFRAIKVLSSKSELQRVVKTVIKFEGSDKLFRSNYDSADYLYFEKLFRDTILNKQKC